MDLYILESQKDGTHYVGISMNIEQRLAEHNNGKVHSTKNKSPWKIIYQESHGDIKSARTREKHLKSYRGVGEKRKIIKQYSGIV
ncbi:MAG: GIY-YIG nuclease family protein [Candidatus Falkowbacteria bacterium]